MASKSDQKIITLILLILIFISSYYFINLFQKRKTFDQVLDIKYGYINNTDKKSIQPIFQSKNNTTQNNTLINLETQNIQLIDINKADKESLITLPGIGAVLAARIIEYRTSNGKFKNNEGLKKVSGIGDKKFKAILSKLQQDKKHINSSSEMSNSQKENASFDKFYCQNCMAELIPDNNRKKTMKPYCPKCLKYLGK